MDNIDNYSLVIRFNDLTEDECIELGKAVIKILKENNVKEYEVKLGKL